jgi:LmbE family N-acetylglucosaminyl deacetylase
MLAPNMALQRTRRPRVRSGRSLRSLGSPLNARPFGGQEREEGKRPARIGGDAVRLLFCSSLFAVGCVLFSEAAETKTILAVFAHPDDETLVGPLLAASARQGVRVQLIIVTQGEKGAFPHAGIPPGPELAKVRAEEARCSCRALGIEAPILLGFSDGELGRLSRPPWGYLADVERELRTQFAKLRPDVVVTFGPEGAYGHPDHRLVGAVVTQLVQAGVEGAPVALLYPGFPKDRLSKSGECCELPWSPTDSRFLTVRVPYTSTDLASTRAALACHKSQFRPEEVEALARWTHQVLGGRVWLRPWFGAKKADDVFKLAIP